MGGRDSLAQVGCAYFNSKFSKLFRKLLEKELNNFGISSMYWEEFYALHIKDLTLYCREFPKGDILEFETIDDLRSFDSDFLLNVDSDIIGNITKTLKCSSNDIVDISVITQTFPYAL